MLSDNLFANIYNLFFGQGMLPICDMLVKFMSYLQPSGQSL